MKAKRKHTTKDRNKSLYSERNRQVAKNRGENWRKKLLRGSSQLGKLRAENGFNQTDFAKKLGIHRSTYIFIESGQRPIDMKRASEISKILKTRKENIFKKLKSGNFETK